MFFKSIAIAASIFVFSTTSSAALLERLDGLAYYDDIADLTWLADANYAYTSGYHPDGRFSWQSANNWAAQLDVSGITGWRLGDTLLSDPGCDNRSQFQSWGYNCTGSEMGNLFYNVLDNTAGTLQNNGPFINIQSFYWTATQPLEADGGAWIFGMQSGLQWEADKDDHLYAWAVHDGDIGWNVHVSDIAAVPVPSTVLLFGSGLIGLFVTSRRKKA
jgi:hypothetical protein